MCAGCSFSSSPSDPDAEIEMLGRACADNTCLAGGLWAVRRTLGCPAPTAGQSRVLLGQGTVSSGAVFMEI